MGVSVQSYVVLILGGWPFCQLTSVWYGCAVLYPCGGAPVPLLPRRGTALDVKFGLDFPAGAGDDGISSSNIGDDNNNNLRMFDTVSHWFQSPGSQFSGIPKAKQEQVLGVLGVRLRIFRVSSAEGACRKWA